MRAGPILLYLAGMALFCGMDAAIKALIAHNPVLMVTWWRYLIATLFTAGLWLWGGRPRLTREMLPVHLLRGVIISASAYLFFWSLTRLTLTEAVTFAFIAPLLVPPLASLMLGEKMEAGSLWAGILGFAGVLVATGLNGDALSRSRIEGIAAVLFSAGTYAVSVILMRARAARDGPIVVSLLGAGIPALILLPFALAFTASTQLLPRGPDIGLFLLIGLLGTVALQFFARAYARVEAQVLAPFEYSALGWAALFGWIFFAEPVQPRTWAGAAIIIAACLWQARRQVVPTPSSPAA